MVDRIHRERDFQGKMYFKERRVIVLIDRYLPILGGAQNNIHEICRGLKKRGFKIKIFTRIIFKGLPRKEVLDGLVIRRFAAFPIRVISKILFVFDIILYLIRNRDDYDFILCVPCALYTEIIPAYIASFFTKKPYIIRMTSYDHLNRMFVPKLGSFSEFTEKILFPSFIWRLALNSAEEIIALSEVLYDQAIKHDIKKARIISSGVDLERFKPATVKEKTNLRKRLAIPNNKIVIITSGRYVKEKNQDLLIKAAEEIDKGKFSGKVFILILGGVELKQISSNEIELKNYVYERGLNNLVKFYEDVLNVEDFLRASDIFVQPTMSKEGLSRVIIEAMACGLPIICSNLTQNICVFPKGYEYFFSPTDKDQIVEHLKTLVKSEKIRSTYGKSLSFFAQKNYSSENVTQNYEKLFQQVQLRRSDKQRID